MYHVVAMEYELERRYGDARGAGVGAIFWCFLKFWGSSQTWTTIPGWDWDAAWTSCVSPGVIQCTWSILNQSINQSINQQFDL